jgi:hypothetical protein
MEDYTKFYNEEDIVWQFNRVMVDKRSKNLKDFLTTDLKNNSKYYGLFSDFLDKTKAIDSAYDIQKVIKENEDLIIEESKKAKETIFVSYLKHHEKKDKIAVGEVDNVVNFVDKVGIYNLDTIVHTHPVSFLPLPSYGDINGLYKLQQYIIESYLEKVNKSSPGIEILMANYLPVLKYAIVSPYFATVIENKNILNRLKLNIPSDKKLYYMLYYGISFSIKWITPDEVKKYINGEIDKKSILANHSKDILRLYDMINSYTDNILEKNLTDIISSALIYNTHLVYSVSRKIYKEQIKENTIIDKYILDLYDSKNKISCSNINMVYYLYAYPSLIQEYYCGNAQFFASNRQDISILPVPIANIPIFALLQE